MFKNRKRFFKPKSFLVFNQINQKIFGQKLIEKQNNYLLNSFLNYFSSQLNINIIIKCLKHFYQNIPDFCRSDPKDISYSSSVLPKTCPNQLIPRWDWSTRRWQPMTSPNACLPSEVWSRVSPVLMSALREKSLLLITPKDFSS